MKFSWFSILMFGTSLNTAFMLSRIAFKSASIPFYNIAFVACCILAVVSFVLMLLDARWNKKNSDKQIWGAITFSRRKGQGK